MNLVSFYSFGSANKNAGGAWPYDHFARPQLDFSFTRCFHRINLGFPHSMRLWLSIPEEISARFAFLLSALAHRSKL